MAFISSLLKKTTVFAVRLYWLALILFGFQIGFSQSASPNRDTYAKRVSVNKKHVTFTNMRRLWNVLKVCLKKATLNLSKAHPADSTITVNPFECDDQDALDRHVFTSLKELFQHLYGSSENKVIASLNTVEDCLAFMKDKPLPNLTLENMIHISTFIENIRVIGQKVNRLNIDVDSIMTKIESKIVRTMAVLSPSYIGVYIPQLFDGTDSQPRCSGHVTLAYGQQVKNQLHRIGSLVQVKVSTTCVFWTDEKGQRHGYYPALVDGKSGHVSMTNDPSPGLNGKHHASHPVTVDATWIPFQSFVMPFFAGGENNVSFDIDGTLVKSHAIFTTPDADGNAVTSYLRDPSKVAELELTPLGTMFVHLNKLNKTQAIGSPKLYVLTSRRDYGGSVKKGAQASLMRQAVSDKFGVPVDQISFGSKIQGNGDAKLRTQGKADDKFLRARNLGVVMHIDDESDVAQEFANGGLSGILYECQKDHLTQIPVSENTSQPREYVKIMFSGYPGAGKTTLANKIIGSLEAKGFQVYFAATDSGDFKPEHLPSFKHVPAGGKLAVIFDSTGDDMTYPSDALVINFSQNITTLVGSINSVLGRKTHATLNGLQSADHTTDQSELTYLNKLFKNNMNIIELIKFYRKIYQNDWNAILANFSDARYSVSFTRLPDGNIILGICYTEGFQHWVSVWGRDCRNIFLYITPDDVTILKGCLQAGCEVKPTDVTSGDVYRRVLGRFQQFLRDCICSGKSIIERTFLSAKVDGCLTQITIHYGQDMYNLMMQHPDMTDFNKELVNTTWEASSHTWFCTIASNGTLLVGKPMEPTFTTAIASHYNVPHEPTDTLMEVWSMCVVKLSASMVFFEAGLVSKTTTTIHFETACPHRTTFVFADRVAELHKELTADYPTGMFVCLGMSLSDNNRYVPHFDIEKLIFTSGFTQPPFWKVNSRSWWRNCKDLLLTGNNRFGTGNIIPYILDDLELVSLGQMTVTEFFTKWQPDNEYAHHGHIDLEGFVLLVASGNSYEYNKLKTLLYYMVHKPNLNNIEELTNAIHGSDYVLKAFPKLRVLCEVQKAIEILNASPLTHQEIYENVLQHIKFNDTSIKFTTAVNRITSTGDYSKMCNFVLGNHSNHLLEDGVTANMLLANYVYERLELLQQIRSIVSQPRVCRHPDFETNFYYNIVKLTLDHCSGKDTAISQLRTQIASNMFN